MRTQGVRQPKLQLRQEVVRRQIAFYAVPLFAVGIEDLDGRGPLRVEALEILRLLFDVDVYRNEVFGDELLNLGIGIYLGFQPSACPSHRRGAEVQQQRLVLLAGLSERGINVFIPGNRHVLLLSLQA
jgi:hypothetical protein